MFLVFLVSAALSEAQRNFGASLLNEHCVSVSSLVASGRIKADPIIRKEIVLVPDNLDRDDAEALAIATRTDLTLSGQKWKLSRSSKTVRAISDEDSLSLSKEIDGVCGRIQALSLRYPKAPSHTLPEALDLFKAQRQSDRLDTSGFQAQETLPAARLLATILRSLPDFKCVLATPGNTAVFSNHPVGDEIGLDVSEKSLDAYLDAQEDFATWASLPNNVESIEGRYRWLLPKRAFRAGVHTVRLSINRQEAESAFSVQVFDDLGQIESGALLTAKRFGEPSGPLRAGKALGRASVSRVHQVAFDSVGPSRSKLGRKALDPLAHDPLDDGVRDALLLYADARGYSKVVACVPDDLLQGLQASLKDGLVDLDAVHRTLEETCSLTERSRTLIVRPRLTQMAEALRSDRRPLGEAYKRAVSGRFDLSALLALHAGYVQRYESPFLSSAIAPLASAFRLSELPNWLLGHPVLALLGEFDSAEMSMLLEGRPVPLGIGQHRSSLVKLAELASWRAAFAESSSTQGSVSFWPDGAKIAVGPMSALARTPERVIYAPNGCWVRGVSSLKTLLRLDTNDEPKVDNSEHGSFMPVQAVLRSIPVPRGENPYEYLATRYRFFWSRERQLNCEFVLGELRFGPFIVRETIETSKSAVSIDKVPGINR